MPIALVCGALGQDGSYLSEQLLALDYRVVGTLRSRASVAGHGVASVTDRIELVETPVMTLEDWRVLIARIKPDEIYNLAGRTSGSAMYEDAVGNGDANGLAVARLLEAIRLERPLARLCQASSSEMFGSSPQAPQDESTPLAPQSPYAAAKAYAHSMVGIYRQRHSLFACSAILFNHESPRRTTAFVTRKITQAAAAISRGLALDLHLGDLMAKRDWGYAPDYVGGMRLMLQATRPDDYVFATGILHTVADVCEIAFESVGLDFRDHVVCDASQSRPSDSRLLVGSAAKARSMLGWTPTLHFEQMIRAMVDADVAHLVGDRAATDQKA